LLSVTHSRALRLPDCFSTGCDDSPSPPSLATCRPTFFFRAFFLDRYLLSSFQRISYDFHLLRVSGNFFPHLYFFSYQATTIPGDKAAFFLSPSSNFSQVTPLRSEQFGDACVPGHLPLRRRGFRQRLPSYLSELQGVLPVWFRFGPSTDMENV